MWNFPLFPEQASTGAGKVDAVFFFELGVILFFALLICVLIVAFAIHYRRGNKVDRSNPPLSSHAMELAWIGIPLAISIVMFVWATHVYYELYQPPGDAFDIYIVGKQWMWKAKHPEGKSEINDLHVPLGRPVKLLMQSQDVIHSYYIPAFRIKQDVLPGRYSEVWFRPTRPGKYHIFCAEYCGTNHSAMGGWIYVMEPSDYERWLAQDSTGASMALEGKKLFVQHHCAGCHGDSAIVKAPRLEGVFGRQVPITERGSTHFITADERYIRDSILLPKSQVVAGYEPVMPSYQGQISEDDLLKIIEYIKSIGPKETGR